jgi:hypothetical protein
MTKTSVCVIALFLRFKSRSFMELTLANLIPRIFSKEFANPIFERRKFSRKLRHFPARPNEFTIELN